MAKDFHIKVYDQQNLVYSGEFREPVVLGRQRSPDEVLYAPVRMGEAWRLPITHVGEQGVPRQHLRVEPLANLSLRLTNLHEKQTVHVLDSEPLQARSTRDVRLPVLLQMGTRAVRFQAIAESEEAVQSLALAPTPPGRSLALPSPLSSIATPGSDLIPVDTMLRWLRSAQEVLHGAAGASDFFARAARALIDLAGLHSGRVLLWQGGDWKLRAAEFAPRISEHQVGRAPSRHILQRVLDEKRTFWQRLGTNAPDEGSLEGVRSVVAAPILDRAGNVIGVLYGDCLETAGSPARRSVSRLEATLAELVATGVAAGLARLEEEGKVLAARVQFEQFFTPALARQLEAEPDLLKGRDAEVSLLFCDIRRFSHLAEYLGATRTSEWMCEVMDALSDCVLAHHGVLVNYIGDELLAMWGAPQVQPDHARLACQAAVAMQEQLPNLNERWKDRLPEPMAFGIGVNTGPARVGNTGSTRKFMYGPLGNTVNLASRVQGATKYYRCRILITGAVQAGLGPEFVTRKLGRVRVQNITEPVLLHELVPVGDDSWLALKKGYEEALARFEEQAFRPAASILGKLLDEYPEDGPSLVLMSRAVGCLVQRPEKFVPVWDLPGK